MAGAVAGGLERDEAGADLVSLAQFAIRLHAGELHVRLQRGAAKRDGAWLGSTAAQYVSVVGADPDRDPECLLELL